MTIVSCPQEMVRLLLGDWVTERKKKERSGARKREVFAPEERCDLNSGLKPGKTVISQEKFYELAHIGLAAHKQHQ